MWLPRQASPKTGFAPWHCRTPFRLNSERISGLSSFGVQIPRGKPF